MFVVNVEGAIRENDKWIIIERSKKEQHAGGLLSLVGGKVEIADHSSDVLENTLRREIFEEIGIQVKRKMKYICSTSFVTDNGVNVVDIVFLCEHESGKAFAKCPDEVENVFWLTTAEILRHPLSPIYLKKSIQSAEAFL